MQLDTLGRLQKCMEKPEQFIKWLRALVIEIFKIVNNLSPNYMKDIFTSKLRPKVRPNDIWSNTKTPLHMVHMACTLSLQLDGGGGGLKFLEKSAGVGGGGIILLWERGRGGGNFVEGVT